MAYVVFSTGAKNASVVVLSAPSGIPALVYVLIVGLSTNTNCDGPIAPSKSGKPTLTLPSARKSTPTVWGFSGGVVGAGLAPPAKARWEIGARASRTIMTKTSRCAERLSGRLSSRAHAVSKLFLQDKFTNLFV